MADSDVWYVVEQAWHQVTRANAAEDRARALSTFRHAISLARRSAGEVTPEVVQRLEQLEGAAAELYDEVRHRSVRPSAASDRSGRASMSRARPRNEDLTEEGVPVNQELLGAAR